MSVDHCRFWSRFLDPRANDIHNFVALSPSPYHFLNTNQLSQLSAYTVSNCNTIRLVRSKRALVKSFTRKGRLTAASRFSLHQRMVDEICACY